MIDKQLKMKDLAGYQDFVSICDNPEKTYDDALKETAKTDFGNAMARLIAIPSEIETMLFLHDQGKIIYHLSIEDYMQEKNKRDGVDIIFADRRITFPGMTNQAFIDVKNVGLKNDGTNYLNLFIELESGWGSHYTDGSTNRYIAYVRDGKRYGGKFATEIDTFSLDKTEKDNEIEIIKYYVKHNELLDHDIYIVQGKHIGEKITAWKQTKEFTKNKKYFYVLLSNWQAKYPLMEVSRTADGWATKNTGKGNLYLSTATEEQMIRDNKRTGSTAEQIETHMERYYERLEHAQQESLTEREVLKVYGLIPEARVVWDKRKEPDLDY